MLELVRDLLTEDGHQVTSHTYRDKDLGEIARLAPDVIILDYMWANDDNSWALLHMLRLNPTTARIPVILCTAAVQEVEAISGHLNQLGVRVVFQPFHIDTLRRQVHAALAAIPA